MSDDWSQMHATLLLARGVAITAVSERLGHSKTSIILDTYAHVLLIEQAFAKSKQTLRRVGARSWGTLVAAVGQALATVTAADARAFFAAGFPLP